MSAVTVEVLKDQKDISPNDKKSISRFPHKISSIVFLLLLIGTTYLFVHSTLQLEHKRDILDYFLEQAFLANFYLIIIPTLVTSATIFIFGISNPDRVINSANFRSFYKIMTYGCRHLLLSSIIMVIIPFVIIYIVLCAHWTLLYEILVDSNGELHQNVTEIEDYEIYALLVIETLMFLYIPKMTIMLLTKVHHRRLECEKNEEKFNGILENVKALIDVCVFQQGTALLASVLVPYHGIKSLCVCKEEAAINDKALIQAAIHGVELKDGAAIVTKRKEQLDPDTFKNVDLFIFLFALFNMIDSTLLYVLFVSTNPLFVIFELIIALELANELLIFCSTVSYVKLLSE